MPVEIHELVIRATVTEAPEHAQQLEQQLARLKAELVEACRGEIEERLARAAER